MKTSCTVTLLGRRSSEKEMSASTLPKNLFSRDSLVSANRIVKTTLAWSPGFASLVHPWQLCQIFWACFLLEFSVYLKTFYAKTAVDFETFLPTAVPEKSRKKEWKELFTKTRASTWMVSAATFCKSEPSFCDNLHFISRKTFCKSKVSSIADNFKIKRQPIGWPDRTIFFSKEESKGVKTVELLTMSNELCVASRGKTLGNNFDFWK